MNPEQKDPLALDVINERRLVAAFLDFLRTKGHKSDTLENTRQELELVRQNLTKAFDLTEERIEILRPAVPLMDIFSTHPDAAPSDPKRVLETELKQTPTASAESKSKAEEFKNKGNDLMKNNQVEEALTAYSQAINHDPTNPILYCNRAAAYSKKNQHDLAAKDCEIALAFDPNYAKAYGRYGLALHGLGLLKEAKEALDKAVSLDPENQLYKNNLKLVEDAILAADAAGAAGQMPGGFPGMPGGMGGMGNMFEMLNNPDFQSSMMQMMQNPQVQQMVGQFSSMFMNQMGGPNNGNGNPAGIPAMPGMPGGMANLQDMMSGALGNLTPEQLAEQMRGMFGGQQPPAAPGSSDSNPNANPNDKKDPPGPSYFS
ncbi:hypothetical protein RvY_03446 [Ramazzottius varieornatus]|uniref:Uncharacterized protein n=1 Tax=Ramazzottius varieornatus TaxID=947166 RepID=A0A1D1UNW3_RAMVA|nr:hypothetical protein RvY_03446 [Ramazzottius varieornatus]